MKTFLNKFKSNELSNYVKRINLIRIYKVYSRTLIEYVDTLNGETHSIVYAIKMSIFSSKSIYVINNDVVEPVQTN